MAPVGSVWHVAREYAGIAEGGGVKDVVRGLADAAHASGLETTVILPWYGFVQVAAPIVRSAGIAVRLCHHDRPWPFITDHARVLETYLDDVRVWLVDADRYREKRAVYVYTAEDQAADPHKMRGTGHWDAHQMNLLLQYVAAHLARSRQKPPDIIHCHDGHTAILPALLARKPGLFRGGSVITLHNAGPGYRQEIYGMKYARRLTRLSHRDLRRAQLGPAVEPAMVGARHATLTTVSPEYAVDLAGEPLGELLASRRIPLHGITNGIDVPEYDPRTPNVAGIAFGFDPGADNLEGKARVREHFLRTVGKEEYATVDVLGSLARLGHGVLISHVGRLARQKGIMRMVDAVRTILNEYPDCGFLILGEGEQELEKAVSDLTEQAAGRVLFLRGYDARMAKTIYAAGDLFLVPSKYEPCGLTDMYAQMMGNIPIVHLVGGLKKVKDGTTGYGFEDESGLANCIRRALADWTHRPALVAQIRRQAFARVLGRYTWSRVFSDHYMPLYEAAVSHP